MNITARILELDQYMWTFYVKLSVC